MLHDSCVYARYENVVSEPRELLAATGTVRFRDISEILIEAAVVPE